MNRVIGSERIDLFDPNIYIAFKVTVTGKPPADLLEKAVRAAFSANEAAMSRVILKDDGTAYYERLQESGCLAAVSEKGWEALLRENERRPFAIRDGEMMRVFILTGGEETGLLLMAHHLAGDGKSMVYFLEQVMQALAGGIPEYRPMRLLDAGSLPKKSRLPFPFRIIPAMYNKRWERTGRSFGWEDYSEIHRACWEQRSSVVLQGHLTREQTERLHENARGMGVSLNSFIAAAFLKTDAGLSTIGLAVDARTDRNRCMSNQATGITADAVYRGELSFAENAVRLHRKIYKKLNAPVYRYFILRFLPLFRPALLDAVLMHAYGIFQNSAAAGLAKLLGYPGPRTGHIGITNLTRLDIAEEYGRYGIRDILFIPPVVSYARQVAGISTDGNGMNLSYHCMSDYAVSEKKAMFENVMAFLKEQAACGEPSA